MKKVSLLVIAGVCIATMFSGCATKAEMSIGFEAEKVISQDTVGRLIIVQGRESWRSPSDGYNKSTRNTHVLQNMADATLNEGYTYFAIARPNEISNLNSASMMNTAEEFIEKCTSSAGSVLTMGNEKCGFVGGGMSKAAAIYAFREQPKTMVVYNAKDVRDYLIKHEKYRDDSYVKVDKFTYPRIVNDDVQGINSLIGEKQAQPVKR